jgi:hypothetical protein
MTKIKAVLDQETWVAVDVPEEFQAIVLSLSSTYSSVNGMDMPGAEDNSKFSDPTSQEPTYSGENNADNGKLTSAIGESKVESTSQTENNASGNQRSTLQTIVHGGVGYHMVNWLVIWTCLLICSIHILSLLLKFGLLNWLKKKRLDSNETKAIIIVVMVILVRYIKAYFFFSKSLYLGNITLLFV